MAADKLTRSGATPGIPAVRYGGAPAKTAAAFTEARNVNGEVAHITRDGAAQFDKKVGLAQCGTMFIKVELEQSLGSRLKSFFFNGTY